MASTAAKRRQKRRVQHGRRSAADAPAAQPASAPVPARRSGRVLGLRLGALAVVLVAGVVAVRLTRDEGDGYDPKEGHSSHVYPWVELPPAEQAELDAELARARTATLRYPTVADAVAAGWVVAQDQPETGAHVVNFEQLDGTFDIDEPDMLLYRGGEPTDPVIAASYHVVTDSTDPPEGFTSENDHWHRHRGICWAPDGTLESVEIDDEDCAERGGERRDDQGGDGWMLHAWVVPGWENPDGIFASINPDLADGSA